MITNKRKYDIIYKINKEIFLEVKMYNKNIVVIFIMCIVLIAIMGIIIFINIYPSKLNKIKIIENGINISGVSISVEENLITNTDIKIIIESENEFVYST